MEGVFLPWPCLRNSHMNQFSISPGFHPTWYGGIDCRQRLISVTDGDAQPTVSQPPSLQQIVIPLLRSCLDFVSCSSFVYLDFAVGKATYQHIVENDLGVVYFTIAAGARGG